MEIQSAEEEGRAILRRLAAEDEDAGVRCAALGKLEEIEFLHQRHREDSAPQPRRTARLQLGKLLAASPAPAGVSPGIVVLYHPSAERRRNALQEIREPALLAEVVAYAEEEDARRAAAERITDNLLLRTTLRKVQSRNKGAARVLRERIKALQQRQKEQEDQVQKMENLCAELEALATAPWEQNYVHRLQHLLGQWQQMAIPLPEECKVRWNAAEKCCQAVLDSHQQQEEFPVQLCKTLEDAIAQLGNPEQNIQETIHTLLEREAREWRAIPEYVTLGEEIKMRRERARDTLQDCAKTLAALEENTSLLKVALRAAEDAATPSEQLQALKQLDTVLKKLPWPGDVPMPAMLAAARKTQRQLTEQCAHVRQQEEETREQIERLFARLHRALRENRFGPARGAYRQLQEKIGAQPEQARVRLQQRLENLEKQLKNLADWKSFATEPQLHELCRQMESLSSEQMHPREKGRRIKDLQDKWRTLGSSPAADDLWPRFREAGDRAFEPCAEFFAKEKARREQNLARRREVLQQLKKCLADADREKPDWQKILPILETAGRMWERCRAVPAEEREALEKNYRDVRASLHTLLAPVLEAHETRKRTLIKQAEALSAHKQAERAATEGQRLQDAWKQLGQSDNEKELLKEFNAALDPVFNRLREEREEKQQVRRSERDALRKMIARIAELAQLDDEGLAHSHEECQSLTEQLETGLSAVSEKERIPLEREFQKVRDRWQERFDTLEERQKEKETEELMRLAALCRRLEEAQENQDDIAKEVETAWGEGPSLPNSLTQRMEQRRQSALARGEDTESGHELAPQRRLLCIQLEILAGLGSPEEDGKIRMQYQMERLRQGLGQDQLSREEKLEQLQELGRDWLCGPVADRKTEQALAGRFEAAYTEARKQIEEPPRAQAKQQKDRKPKPRNKAKQRPNGKKRKWQKNR